jgi:hypothetical protein
MSHTQNLNHDVSASAIFSEGFASHRLISQALALNLNGLYCDQQIMPPGVCLCSSRCAALNAQHAIVVLLRLHVLYHFTRREEEHDYG